ncbi:hypothetical protein JCM10212_004416 [Sporobolomyces blumeae]
MIDGIAAIGACVQIVKTLYEYYDLHKRNRALLDILEGFSQNLEIGIERLKAREELFGLAQNDALDSIVRDFTNAKNWLIANDKNLRSFWTALQAADKLKDLDARLTKAFATKMSIAIFSALQDTRHGVQKIQTTLEGLPTNLESVCRTSTKEAIREAIGELKVEAEKARGGGGGAGGGGSVVGALGTEGGRGFRNGEAEKIISQLVDQLAEQERIKEEEEEFNLLSYTPLEPSTSASRPAPYVPRPASSLTSRRSLSYVSTPLASTEENPFEPTLSTSRDARSEDPVEPTRTTSRADPRSSSNLQAVPYSRSSSTAPSTLSRSSTAPARPRSSSASTNPSSLAASSASFAMDDEYDLDLKGKQRQKTTKPSLPPGSILFVPRDPLTGENLVDPVLANDGLIHDRWSLVHPSSSPPPKNLRNPQEPLVITGEIVQLREAIFEREPEWREGFVKKRETFKRETIDLYASSSYLDLPTLHNRLSHVLLYDPLSISTLVRRGVVRYRMRELEGAIRDLDRAVEFSQEAVRARATPGDDDPERGEEGDARRDSVDLDALRFRALVREEINDIPSARIDLNRLLALSPTDVLALSLRAKLYGLEGDPTRARATLERCNDAVRNDKTYRSPNGDAECDLEYLSRGWAYSSIHDYSSAVADFSFSVSLKDPPEPYALACRAVASLKLEESANPNLVPLRSSSIPQTSSLSSKASTDSIFDNALSDLDRAIDDWKDLAERYEAVSGGTRTETSGIERFARRANEGLPRCVWDCLLLRASARQTQGEPQLALVDFETALRLRPTAIGDSSTLRCALAELRLECDDQPGARRELEQALALAGSAQEREQIEVVRLQLGM